MLYEVMPSDQNNSFRITGNIGLITLPKNTRSKLVSSGNDAATGDLFRYVTVNKVTHSRKRAITAAKAAPWIPNSGKPNSPKIREYERKVLMISAPTLITVGVLTSPVER